jgi:hypothetical protein
MPNWCQNSLVITHDDPAMIARAKAAFEAEKLFNEFIPVPQDLVETVSGYMGDGEEQRNLEAQSAKNRHAYGYANWYDFCIGEWGVKWDVGNGEITSETENMLVMYFDTAWSPAIAAYEKLIEQGFGIEAMYYEAGMGFCGSYTSDGGDDHIDITGDSSWVERNIPPEIDAQFAISEWMSESEQENAEYEDEDENEVLIDQVVERIKEDVAKGDVTAVAELLGFIPVEKLKVYLDPENN